MIQPEQAGRPVLGWLGRLLGVAVSLGLLAWCVWLAWRPENRDNIRLLRAAPAHLFLLLLALSAMSLFINGTTFWITMRHVGRVPFWRMQATNVIASFLGYLPFKLSLLARVVIHNRRDAVPVLSVGGWLAANAAIALGVLVPVSLVSLWRHEFDLWYLAAAGSGLTAVYGVVLAVARFAGGPAGLSRFGRLAEITRVGFLARFAKSETFARVHAALDILRHPGTLALAMLTRAADIGVQAARLVVAAHAMNTPMPWETALLLGSAFFLIGVSSPTGAIGSREGGSTGLAALLPTIDHKAFAVVALAVSATEMMVYTLALVPAMIYVKPWRLVGPRGR